MDPFATPAELAAYLGRAPFTDLELTQAELILDDASTAVRDFCGQAISLVEDDELELAGVWEHTLELPERPIVSVSSVAIDGLELVELVDFVVVSEGLRRGPVAGTDAYAGRSCGYYWGGPAARVAIVYSHGFEDGAEPLKTARGVTLAASARGVANATGVIQEAIGSYSVTYGSGTGAGELADGEKSRLRRRGLARRPTTIITRGVLAT